MRGNKLLIYPLIFLLVLVPVFAVALITFRPGESNDCGAVASPVSYAAHTHGSGLVTEIRDGMQLVFNVSPAAQLYQVVDGQLQLCGGDVTDADLKHITVDVNDAALALGERLPVTVSLEVRRADTGAVIVQAAAPAMYAPGHGYHFGDNYRVPAGATYDWTVTISPVQALRQEGAQDLWLEPVEWSGRFTLDEGGQVIGSRAPQMIGEVLRDGLHIVLSYLDEPQQLYAVQDGVSEPLPIEPDSRYYLVDVTDHAVNYEEKLPGATVTVTFRRYGVEITVPFQPVIAPGLGFHYGANVPLEPGDWQAEVEVSGLDFLRHAGAALSLARAPVRESFDLTIAPPEA